MAAVELAAPALKIRESLESAWTVGNELLEQFPKRQDEIAEFRDRYLAWESKTAAVLEAGFAVSGFLTTSPKDEFTSTAISLLDLKISSTTIPFERLSEVENDIREKLRVIRSIDDRLDIYPGHSTTPPRNPAPTSDDAPIFLVHGRDLLRREVVRRFLETVTDRQIVVLAEQPNRGQDLLGKLLTNAQEASFAVVLLTPDDVGGLSNDELRPRARQNVVFELGMFIALLGREKVAALNDPGVELPTDFAGVAYIPVDGESWQIELVRELKAAGIEASLDRAI